MGSSVIDTPDFGAIVADYLRNRERSIWHIEPSVGPDGERKWYWHAHSLGGCPRAAILERAQLANDPVTDESLLTMEQGTWMHSLLEAALPLNDQDISVIATEQGGAHRTLPLKAKPDAIAKWRDTIYVMDYKTESAGSARMRKSDTKNPVRWQHQLQVTGGGMVAEDIGLVNRATHGMVIYISRQKNDTGREVWTFTPETFEITPEHRQEVVNNLDALEEAWAAYEREQALPDRLGPEMRFGKQVAPWRCKPMSESDPRGMYCGARSACFSLPPTPAQ